MNDETDKEMRPEVRPIYERMKADAIARLAVDGPMNKSDQLAHVFVDGRKWTLRLYFRPTENGTEEQFEYYDYRYFHRKVIP